MDIGSEKQEIMINSIMCSVEDMNLYWSRQYNVNRKA